MTDDERGLVERFLAARKDPALTVLEGFHPVKHALRFGAEFAQIVTGDRQRLEQLVAEFAPDIGDTLRRHAQPVSREVFDHLAPVAPASRVMAVAHRRSTTAAEILSGPPATPVVFLDKPSHLGNIGAVVRVAAAVGASAVISRGPQDPWHPAAIRGAAGLQFALRVARTDSIPDTSLPFVAIHPDGEPLDIGEIPAQSVLAFGSESKGMSKEALARADTLVRIPMQRGVSSLNLATAVAAVLYAWRFALTRCASSAGLDTPRSKGASKRCTLPT